MIAIKIIWNVNNFRKNNVIFNYMLLFIYNLSALKYINQVGVMKLVKRSSSDFDKVQIIYYDKFKIFRSKAYLSFKNLFCSITYHL